MPFKSNQESITDFYYNPEIGDTVYLFSGYNVYAKHLYNEGVRVFEINAVAKNTKQGYSYNKYFYSTNEVTQMLTLINGKYFLFKTHNININYKDPKQFLEPVLACVDKNSGAKKVYENAIFPENYRAGNFYGLGSNIIPIGTYNYSNYYYYSFAKSNNLYKLNTITGSVEKKEIKSKYFNGYWKVLNENDAFVIDKINTYNITEPKYIKLLYDSINNVIYRFFYHALPLKNNDSLYNTIRDKPFSIQVINTNLNLIAEVPFKDYAYIPEYAFIDKNGLLNMTINNYKIGDTSYSYVIQKFKLHGL